MTLPSMSFSGAEDDLLARVSLSRLAEPEDKAVAALVEDAGPCGALATIETARGPWRRFAPRLATLDAERDLAIAARIGARVVVPSGPEWPESLDQLAFPPHCLWVTGPLPVSDLARSVAIVGSRACTSYGLHVAAEIAAGVSSGGWVVVSGAAYGIDAAAHRGALAGPSPTVAVLASGLDRPYPSGNTSLIRQIGETGAVVSETPPGCAPLKSRFRARNRLIAALTRATVVIEGTNRSGSKITATAASDLGRDVGAVPGPVTSAESAGCHQLIRNGATLVTDAADVLEMLSPIGSRLAPRRAVDGDAGAAAPDAALSVALDGLDDTTLRVYDQMPRRAPTSVEAIVSLTTLPWANVRASLSRLEVRGLVRESDGSWVVVRSPGRRP